MTGPSSTLSRVRDRVLLAAAWAAGLAFATIFAISLAQIVARQVTGGWVWAADLTGLLFAWMVMLGAAAAYGRSDHIAATFLIERAPASGRRAAAYVVRAIELAIGLIVLLSGLQVAQTRMSIPYIQLGVPTGWAFLSIPVLGALIVFFALTSRPHIPTTVEQVESETVLGGGHA